MQCSLTNDARWIEIATCDGHEQIQLPSVYWTSPLRRRKGRKEREERERKERLKDTKKRGNREEREWKEKRKTNEKEGIERE